MCAPRSRKAQGDFDPRRHSSSRYTIDSRPSQIISPRRLLDGHGRALPDRSSTESGSPLARSSELYALVGDNLSFYRLDANNPTRERPYEITIRPPFVYPCRAGG